MDSNTTSGIIMKQNSDLTFIKFDDNIFIVKKDRKGKYPKDYFVTSQTVIEELNDITNKVSVIDQRYNLIVDNFSNTDQGGQEVG